MSLSALNPSAIQSSHEWQLTGRLAEAEPPVALTLAPLPFRIGRKPGTSLTVPRSTISSLHAEFYEHGDALYLRDLNSTNGTYVNGQRLTGEAQVHDNDLVQFADLPFRISLTEDEHASRTRNKDVCDGALALVQFDRLASGASVIPHYQPIVKIDTREVIAYEALARSRLLGLETPMLMFAAAESLGMTAELSRAIRKRAIDESGLFSALPHVFLNTHPSETDIDVLLESCRVLRDASPQQPITIEIHEAAITNVVGMATLRSGLDALDMALAFDDFGKGQARIAEIAEVRPKYLKFDRELLSNLDVAEDSRKHVVKSMVSMALDLGVIPLAEGVETEGEREACLEAGFVLAQGWLFGRPMPVTHYLKRE